MIHDDSVELAFVIDDSAQLWSARPTLPVVSTSLTYTAYISAKIKKIANEPPVSRFSDSERN